jgi:single-strand DNA-binding protein
MNKIIIIGRAGSDAELRYTAKSIPIMNLSVADSHPIGEGKYETTWHRIVLFGKLAEVLSPMIKKGIQLYVEGRLQVRQWVDKDSQTKTSTEVNVEKLLILERKQQQKSETQNTGYSEEQIDERFAGKLDEEDVPF